MTKQSSTPKFKLKFYFIIFFLIILNFLLFLVSVSIGRYKIPISLIFKVVIARIFNLNLNFDPNLDIIIFNIRLPRIIFAMLVGSVLSQSGVSFQGLFNNPLVSPYILGISGGAGFGAAIGILFFNNFLYVSFFSFIFSIISVILTILVSKYSRSTSSVNLVLSGFIIGSFFTSLLSLLKYYADPFFKLPSIVFWLMGSFNSITNSDLVTSLPFFIIGIVLLMLLRWKLNILSLGDEEAITLGENPKILRMIIILICSLLTTISVSFCGIIGWVGLAVPHIARLIIGPDYRYLLPVSALFGSIYLLSIDNISRALTTTEIPIGILTSIIGAPIFIYVLRRASK